MQSPIDINEETIRLEKIPFPKVRYEGTEISTVENNGWSILFHCKGKNQIITDKKVYDLNQFHFHSQSEHTFNGKRYLLEMHLVHQAENGNFLVLAILFSVGKPNSEFQDNFWSTLPSIDEKKTYGMKIDLLKLIDLEEGFFKYDGSLTTPPYTEGVTWIIQNKLQTISETQVKRYREIFLKETYREIQTVHPNSVTFAFKDGREPISNGRGCLTLHSPTILS